MEANTPREPESSRQPRIAVVTGGSGQIGRAIACGLGAQGCHIVVGYCSNAPNADETVRQVRATGSAAIAVQADLRVEEDIIRLFAASNEHFGWPADILINNAATRQRATVGEIGMRDWSEMLDVNVRAVGICTRHFVERLRGGTGDVINISSTAALAPLARSPHYVASKGAVIALTRALSLELAPQVRVNGVAPGVVRVDDESRVPERERLKQHIPLGRLVEVKEIAATVEFLVRPGLCITGQTLVIDGGWSAGYATV